MTTVTAWKMLPIAVYGVILLFCIIRGEEPHCSKFDFEEKMLEKMVRMEFEMERIKLEMQKNIMTVQNMNEQFEKNVDIFSKKKENIDEQIGQLETFKDKLSEEIKSKLQIEPSNFKEVQRKPTVAFKARSNASINVQSGQTIVFPVVILNEGNGYDNNSGVFTAPVNGTYLFTVAFCVKNGNLLTLVIMVDGNMQSSTLFYGNNAHQECHSADANAVLTAGKTVRVQENPGGHTGDIIYHDSYRWNTFSGVLVNA